MGTQSVQRFFGVVEYILGYRSYKFFFFSINVSKPFAVNKSKFHFSIKSLKIS